MTVDLSKAKAGDTVKFRCGGSHVLPKDVEPWSGNDGYSAVWFKMPGGRKYSDDGHFDMGEHPFDIVEVVRKPLQFSDFKPGMAFFEGDSVVIATSIDENGFRYVKAPISGWRGCKTIDTLIRAPEHDIKEPAQ